MCDVISMSYVICSWLIFFVSKKTKNDIPRGRDLKLFRSRPRPAAPAAALAREAGRALGAAGPGKDAQGDFRQPDSPRTIRRESEVRRHRDLEAAADAVAVDRGDEQLRRAFHFV